MLKPIYGRDVKRGMMLQFPFYVAVVTAEFVERSAKPAKVRYRYNQQINEIEIRADQQYMLIESAEEEQTEEKSGENDPPTGVENNQTDTPPPPENPETGTETEQETPEPPQENRLAALRAKQAAKSNK